MDERIKLMRQCEWEEVFLSWYENEGKNSGRKQLAKDRGYVSWADWRLKGYARRFDCEKASWGFYEILDPSQVILNWFGGPFRTWIERHYDGEKTKPFFELAARSDILDNPNVKSIMENYPKDSVVSALKLSDGRIFVIEGMHRSCALAIMAQKGESFRNNLIFAIGDSGLTELPPVSRNMSE